MAIRINVEPGEDDAICVTFFADEMAVRMLASPENLRACAAHLALFVDEIEAARAAKGGDQ